MTKESATEPNESPKRDLVDRLLVRVPGLATRMAGSVRRIEPGSTFRRRLINLQVKRAFAAMARSDVEVVVLSYEPDAEVWMRSMSGVGMSDCYRGRGPPCRRRRIRRLRTEQRGEDRLERWGNGGEVFTPGLGCMAGVVVEDGWKRALAAMGLSEQDAQRSDVEPG